MTNVIDVTGRTRRTRSRAGADTGTSSCHESLPDIDDDVFWCERADGAAVPTATLSVERIAAIVVKGWFALYPLVREHKHRRTRVPAYLMRFGQICERPLVPAAEALYVAYFEDGAWPEDIPDALMDFGFATAENATVCTRHALRLHRMLSVFRNSSWANNQAPFEPVCVDESVLLLAEVMMVEHRRWANAKKQIQIVS